MNRRPDHQPDDGAAEDRPDSAPEDPLDSTPEDRETAALLRGVLHREADAVHPSPDGLARILAGAQAARSEPGEGAPPVPVQAAEPDPEPLKLKTMELDIVARGEGTGSAADSAPGAAGATVRPLVPRQRPASPGRLSRWLPALAAAAVVAVLGGLGAVRLGVLHAPGRASFVGAGT
jgi:hypothetical protein